VNHSFVAQIFRIVLEGARGLGPLFEGSGFKHG
jgi:hypothetical protein